MLLAHRPTEELIAVEHANLGHIAWIVADSDRLADISGELGLAVAKTEEADAVAPHPARLGVVHEQQVEAFTAVSQGRAGLPAGSRTSTSSSVWSACQIALGLSAR